MNLYQSHLCKTLYCNGYMSESKTVNSESTASSEVVFVSKCLSKQHSHFENSIQ